MPKQRNVCMLAAENAALPNAKVGGIGDVVRDIPRALAAQNTTVTVVIPSYGSLHLTDDAKLVKVLSVSFMGDEVEVSVYKRFADSGSGVANYVLHAHTFSACGAGNIYCNDPDHQPFATDATKFALFSIAALRFLQSGIIDQIDTLHLHDWHTAFAAVLLKYDPAFKELAKIHTVYSIHNLAMQGIRPFRKHNSSLESWYPKLQYDESLLADPRWSDCINPMAAAIRLCDKIHTVSPTYAKEIQVPSDILRGFHGGEGLETDLQAASKETRLVGIVNGTQYDSPSTQVMDWPSLQTNIAARIEPWTHNQLSSRAVDELANRRIKSWKTLTPLHLITSVGRLTDQKMSLMLYKPDGKLTALELMLDSLGNKGVFILLASGSTDLEISCERIASQRDNFLFLNQFDTEIADWLYANGDLFLMPSSFEPCGISQMMAMRYGQPCLAHAVGGLRDTIKDNIDGFLFSGVSQENQAWHLVERVTEILAQRTEKPEAFQRVCDAARAKRFTWDRVATNYIEQLYS